MDLSAFAEGGKKGPKPKAEWELAPLAITYQGTILAFDPSTSKTGWVHSHCFGNTFKLKQTGLFEPAACGKPKSAADILGKGDLLFIEVLRLIDLIHPNEVVHAAPAINAGRYYQAEMTYTPIMAIRAAARSRGIPVTMITDLAVKYRFTGNQKADKKDVHAVLREMVPEINELRPNNEDTRDAAAFAAVFAEEHT
jgi:Holliday junction resolvasome RuvABC endonuclease subunit